MILTHNEKNERITTTMEDKIKGKTGRDQPRTPFMKQIIENIGRITYKELKIVMI